MAISAFAPAPAGISNIFAPPPEAAVKPPEDRGKQAGDFAREQIGKPYSWGGNGPGGFDCSGLVKESLKAAGVDDVPRISNAQLTGGDEVKYDAEAIKDPAKADEALNPGDVIITNDGDHAMLYVGDGKIIEAQQTGTTILERDLKDIDGIVGIRRYIKE